MKKIISVVVILGLVVIGSIIGFKEYGNIQTEREQETLEFIKENYNELCELGSEFNDVEYDYYGYREEQTIYDEIASDIENVIEELKQYEVKPFKNDEEYNEILKLFIEATEDFRKSVVAKADYCSTFDSDDMIEQNKYMREWNKKADDVLDFIEEKTLLNESEEL